MASQPVQPFLVYTAANSPNAFQWSGQLPKLPLHLGGSGSHLTHGSLGPPRQPPKRHLDRFTRFCTAHPCAQHSDTQTHTQIHRPRWMWYLSSSMLKQSGVYFRHRTESAISITPTRTMFCWLQWLRQAATQHKVRRTIILVRWTTSMEPTAVVHTLRS